eukprot:8615321-Lingulodinium_polyedra.AAC.1
MGGGAIWGHGWVRRPPAPRLMGRARRGRFPERQLGPVRQDGGRKAGNLERGQEVELRLPRDVVRDDPAARRRGLGAGVGRLVALPAGLLRGPGRDAALFASVCSYLFSGRRRRPRQPSQ